MDTDSFIVHVEASDTSNFKIDKPFPEGKN